MKTLFFFRQKSKDFQPKDFVKAFWKPSLLISTNVSKFHLKKWPKTLKNNNINWIKSHINIDQREHVSISILIFSISLKNSKLMNIGLLFTRVTMIDVGISSQYVCFKPMPCNTQYFLDQFQLHYEVVQRNVAYKWMQRQQFPRHLLRPSRNSTKLLNTNFSEG